MQCALRRGKLAELVTRSQHSSCEPGACDCQGRHHFTSEITTLDELPVEMKVREMMRQSSRRKSSFGQVEAVTL